MFGERKDVENFRYERQSSSTMKSCIWTQHFVEHFVGTTDTIRQSHRWGCSRALEKMQHGGLRSLTSQGWPCRLSGLWIARVWAMFSGGSTRSRCLSCWSLELTSQGHAVIHSSLSTAEESGPFQVTGVVGSRSGEPSARVAKPTVCKSTRRTTTRDASRSWLRRRGYRRSKRL